MDTPERLGGGRSGQVFLIETPEGRVARKVFTGDRVTHLIHYLFYGAPNAYIWNEDAIRCAYHRRRILSALIPEWFGPHLHVAEAIGVGWDADAKAYYLDAAFVPGRPVPLLHPFRRESEELETLARQVMPPLQQRLVDAGFDGLVWQAGKGNPVALNNFLRVDSGAARFAWIDLESGVPAFVPIHPAAFLTYYLPRAIHHGRPLFDDVAIDRLKGYLDRHGSGLGGGREEALREHLAGLDRHQARWKAVPRAERSIRYQHGKGRISDAEAAWYARHPWRWYGREGLRLTGKALRALFLHLPVRVVEWLQRVDYRAAARAAWKYATSSRYRLELARKYTTGRIARWREREQLRPEEAEELQQRLHDDRSTGYLTDFGFHLGLKGLVLTLEYSLFALLYLFGAITLPMLGALVVLDGPILRSAYTLSRFVPAVAKREEAPWVALGVGVLPLVGNLAYPMQTVYSAAGRDRLVARFLVYDSITALGEKLPVVGGRDTLTEHAFNRLAHRLLRARRAPDRSPERRGERGSEIR